MVRTIFLVIAIVLIITASIGVGYFYYSQDGSGIRNGGTTNKPSMENPKLSVPYHNIDDDGYLKFKLKNENDFPIQLVKIKINNSEETAYDFIASGDTSNEFSIRRQYFKEIKSEDEYELSLSVYFINADKTNQTQQENFSYEAKLNGGVVCSEETQKCPDGTMVKRSGLDCKFEKCPEIEDVDCRREGLEEDYSEEDPEWETYESEEYGYQLNYPNDWQFSINRKIIDFNKKNNSYKIGDRNVPGIEISVSKKEDQFTRKYVDMARRLNNDVYCMEVDEQEAFRVSSYSKYETIFDYEGNTYVITSPDFRNYKTNNEVWEVHRLITGTWKFNDDEEEEEEATDSI